MIPGKRYTPNDLLAIVNRYKWLLVCPPVIGLFVALLVSARLPNTYESDMLISIVPQRVPESFVQSTVTLRIEERLDAITQQAKSRTVLEDLINEFDLYPDERTALPLDDVINRMRQAVAVELEAPRRGPRGPEPAHAFHVKFSYFDPEVAARVTQRIGSLFVDRNALERGALAEATNAFLESQLKEARQKLEAHEHKMEAFRRSHGNELPTQQGSNLQVVQNTQMQIQAMIEATARDRDRRLMLERLYNEVRTEPIIVQQPAPNQAPEATPAISGGSTQQQLDAARANYERLSLRLRAEHPDMARARRTISELEARVAAEKAAPAPETPSSLPAPVTTEDVARRDRLRDMRAEMESLDRQLAFKESEIENLRTKMGEYQRRVEAVPGLESEWTALSRDYDTLTQTYRNLLQKSEASRVAVDLEERQIGEQFRVLDPARVPVHPTGPFRIRITAIGLGAGFALGVGLAALLALRDSSFRSESDVFQSLSLPVLARVPLVEGEREIRSRVRRRWLTSSVVTASLAVAGYVVWTMKLWKFVA
jgi:polysaccharide chain length determinant protein (PEP-CTERM system associated)